MSERRFFEASAAHEVDALIIHVFGLPVELFPPGLALPAIEHQQPALTASEGFHVIGQLASALRRGFGAATDFNFDGYRSLPC